MKYVTMRRVSLTLALLAGMATVAAGGRVCAKPTEHRTMEHRVTAQQKAASDQAMQAGLADLQAAAGATQGGNASQVGGNLQSAVSAMQSALPIYDGHRERSIHAAGAALKVLGENKKNAVRRVAKHLANAIAEAQAALRVN